MIDLDFLDPVASTTLPRSPVGDTLGAGSLVDRSLVAKTELQTGPGDTAALAAAVERATGAPPQTGRAVEANGAWWCPLTPTRILVIGEPPVGVESPISAVTVTSGFAAFGLSGPTARPVLARVSALDLRHAEAGTLLPGSVARVPAIVLCRREEELLILAGSAHAGYLWETLVDAGGPLGLMRAAEPSPVAHA